MGREVGEAAADGVMTGRLTLDVPSVALRTLFKVFSKEGIDR